MKKATKKEILETALLMENKYFDLVWIARKQPDDYFNPNIKKPMDEVAKKYPKEVKEIFIGEDPDWNHGFNSGCLAAFRLILSMSEYGVEEAFDEFPFLDT
jgi:hypothetical protein